MDELAPILIASFTTLLASSGLWTYLANRREKKSATTRLLMGLAHDKITYLGMKHVNAGFISRDDYEDFRQYLYEPYKELGGNGTVERIAKAIETLPLTDNGTNKQRRFSD